MGTGCKKCQQLEANAKEAVANLNLTAEVSHIIDPIEFCICDANRRISRANALPIPANPARSERKFLAGDRL
ncbi:MAG: thioredoxin family protein [Microcoleus sp.]